MGQIMNSRAAWATSQNWGMSEAGGMWISMMGLAIILILQRWKQIDAKFKAIFGYTASRPTWAT